MCNLECPNCGQNREFSSNAALWYAKHHKTWCKSCAVKYKHPNTKLGTAKRLLEESYESYYWLGLLAADGHFASNGRLKISLSDYDTIKNFSIFLKMKTFKSNLPRSINHKAMYSISLMDADNILPLMNKYKIVSNKTYNPIDFSVIKGLRNRIAFITGFIDGDGCIKNLHNRKDFQLSIKIHKSWEVVLKQIGIILKNNDKLHYYQDYIILNVGDSVLLKKLKRIVLNLDLPIMKRKWDIIDLNFISKQELGKQRQKIILKLKDNNKSITEIMKITNFSYGLIYQVLKRKNL